MVRFVQLFLLIVENLKTTSSRMKAIYSSSGGLGIISIMFPLCCCYCITKCIVTLGKIRHKFRTAIANDPITPLKNMIHFGKTALNWMKMNNNTMVELYCQKDPDSHSGDLCT